MMMGSISVLLLLLTILGSSVAHAATPLVRSVRDGRWSDAATWEGGRVPGQGARVQVRAGHVVVYDLVGNETIRSIHVAGTLRFHPERDTRLDVGLIKIQAGDDPSESGFDCESHAVVPPGAGATRGRWKSGHRIIRLPSDARR